MTHLLRCHPLRAVDFVRGVNTCLYDRAGRRYLDFESGSWAAVLGHGHPAIRAALHDQIDRVVHLGVRTPNALAEEAAVAVLARTGWPEGRCTFLSSGSEAVEFAVQAVRRTTGRPLLLTWRDTYLAAYGSAGRKDPAEWCLLERTAEPEGRDPAALLATLPWAQIGGLVFEPGGGGPCFGHTPPPALVRALAQRVQAEGGYVVVNEVTTGLGRTGRWFGYEDFALAPDAVALGKALGNGYPVSAVALRGPLAAALERSGAYHAQSHQNNPLGCAAALAVLATLEAERLIARSAQRGAALGARLRALAAARPEAIRAVRGRGLLLALELQPGAGRCGAALQAALFERGLIVGGYAATHPAGTGLRFDPPLTVTEAEEDELLAALEDVVR